MEQFLEAVFGEKATGVAAVALLYNVIAVVYSVYAARTTKSVIKHLRERELGADFFASFAKLIVQARKD